VTTFRAGHKGPPDVFLGERDVFLGEPVNERDHSASLFLLSSERVEALRSAKCAFVGLPDLPNTSRSRLYLIDRAQVQLWNTVSDDAVGPL